ncbi:restriction endonuclease subunit S [Thalassobius vesicularis]|uniref:Restriction endonuclease subunit S n=1 Tax=Thalassobius vesicularis TaxID=1294297 RepID=A0A4S3M758_9RHOB|nr:restriction endonuclease subunit S [Thalassobius vesicularis]THD72564.1 restriction endonuclease subunit S [Thalassobius vesicularis]
MNIAAYPKYDDYKESGFTPVGEIPTHWTCSRIRHAAEISPSRRLDGNTGREEQVVFLPMEAVGDNGQIDQSNIRLSREVSEGFTYFQRGDVVMAKITPCFENGKGAYLKELSTKYGFGTTELHVMRPREVTGEFLYYFLNRSAFRTYSEVFMVGSAGQKRVSTDFLKNQLIPIPPLPEQRAIAAFLDGKCGTIDEAVRIKEEQIRLLAERRQILIQEAVTRGLNPDAPMKDSGIDWIGHIPSHWDVLPLKYIAALRSGDTISAESFTEAGYPVYGGNGFRGFTSRYTHRGHFALIGRQGALCGNVNYADGEFFASEHAIVATPKRQIKTVWLGEIIRCANFNRLSQSAAQPGISVEVIGNQRLPLPPQCEQQPIVDYVEREAGKIDAALSLKQTQISALREYKTSLINAAVTGKIKVL